MNHYEAKQEARRQRLENRADRLSQEGDALYKKAAKMASGIPFGQPILIGHHSEQRDRNYRGKIHSTFGKSFETMKQAEEVAARAAAVGLGGISSDDPDAIVKLHEQLKEAKDCQAKMVAGNKLVRKGDIAGLAEMFGQKVAEALMRPGQVGGQGFAHFQLSNNSANIRRLKGRIAQLEKNAQREEREVLHNSGVRLVENVEANRIQIFFPGKPEADVRSMLKGRGFRWSPSEGAWQRHLNNAGVYAAKDILEKLTGG